MPTYNIPLTKINQQEATRYAGLRKQADFPKHLIPEACAEVLTLARARACWQLYQYSAGLICAPKPLALNGATITEHLSGATSVAVLAVTIGELPEEKSSAYFDKGSYTAGLLLDAAASAAVEDSADIVNELIATQMRAQGFSVTTRFSPGYGDWPINDQAEVLALAGGGEIGITVTPSFMLLPRKSITAVIGLYPASITVGRNCKTHCEHCLKTDCHARKE